jgi:carboxyl-terminal processing protease
MMHAFKLICLSVLVFIVLNSCQKLLIKPDPTGESERNFEIFWNDLNNGYPYFAEDGINWKDRHDQYRKLVTKSTTTSQLYNYMTQMLAGFSDGHLSVSYGSNSYSNEKVQPNLGELIRANSSGSLLSNTSDNNRLINDYLGFQVSNPAHTFESINNNYLSSSQTVTANDGFVNSSETTVAIHGKIDSKYSALKNIYYVNISTFNTEYSIENMLESIILNNNPEAIILDLRMNGGGSLGLMWDAMSVFMPSSVSELKYAYSKEKVGPLPGNFGPEKYFAIFGKDNIKFLNKPIVVLTNRVTISAAEHATMALREMKKFNFRIKIVGDYTFGATSFIVERTLPNGIQYTLVNSKTSDINHNVVEKTGVRPDEQVFLTSDAVKSGRDEQMERAIDIIKNNQF